MNFFNPFQNQQGCPYNPNSQNRSNNSQQNTQSHSNQGFNPFAAFGIPGNQGFVDGSNVYINNHTNVNNNYYGMPGAQQNPYTVNVNYNGNPNNRSQNSAQQTKTAGSDKNSEMSQAENNPNSAHYYKRIGNEYFKKGLYAQAIENYTKAIEMSDSESIFFSNRARCYKNLKQFEKAYEDAKVAIELDDQNIKGFILCGQILAELGKVEEGMDKLNRAVTRFTKALNLCNTPDKKEFEKEAQKNILRVRKVIWLKQEAQKKEKKAQTVSFFKELIQKSEMVVEEEEKKDQEKTKFEEFNDLVKDSFTPTLESIPDDLCCKITMDFMQDPVMTPAGITYERHALVEHLSRNGHFDPVTREKIDPKYIFPNKAIKQYCEDFLKKNPWAFEFQDNQSYLDIKF